MALTVEQIKNVESVLINNLRNKFQSEETQQYNKVLFALFIRNENIF
ncbi:MAG: hypothetical protein FWH18_00395 [Marinilabiliaceae bacterium]|nr:hypothetical protein [Marinilabiliaceae bacterium]